MIARRSFHVRVMALAVPVLVAASASTARAQSDWWGAIVATSARERIQFANASAASSAFS